MGQTSTRSSGHAAARTYLIIWGWLAGLMLLGVALSALPLPKAAIVAMVLGLSSIKALLVALYYMHLKIDRRLVAFIAAAPFLLLALALGVVYSSTFVHL